MNVLIIGATGQVGGHATDYAVRADHRVTAFGRSTDRLEAKDGLDIVKGDVLDRDDVAGAMRGQDAVILTFGAPLNADTLTSVPTLARDGTANVIDAMAAAGVPRLVCMTAIGAGDSEGHGRLVFRRFIEPVLLGRIMEDRTRQEELVRASDVPEWVIVRPTELSDDEAGPVTVIEDLDGDVEPSTIPREDVGRWLVGLVCDKRFDGRTILITKEAA